MDLVTNLTVTFHNKRTMRLDSIALFVCFTLWKSNSTRDTLKIEIY